MQIMTGLLVLVCSLCVTVEGYQHFQQQIPNGDFVPDPSIAKTLWGGVGHTITNGGGTRNAFGKDFAANGFKWDACLCKRDSDNDGLTNGQELGDPDCVWTLGEKPSTKDNLSHPGICEPLESGDCKVQNAEIDFTASQPFVCSQKDEPNVIESIFRFDPTEIPAKETNYFCQYFPLNIPAGEKQHIIAYEPIIDNQEVMHHTVVYGCREEQAAEFDPQNLTSSLNCGGQMRSCNEIILVWTVGINGICYDGSYGVLIGDGGYTSFWMEHHWNNPREASGLIDSSGIKLYHTAELRNSSAAYILWGTSALELPVGMENHVQTGGCNAACTKDFASESFSITQILPHMHYYGRKMTVRHVRPGEFERMIFVEDNYEYDNPVLTQFDNPIEFKRGDEMQVNCSYTTTSAISPTFFGLGTNDEMCLMVALVHPYDASIPVFCNDYDNHGFCKRIPYGDFGNCDLNAFLQNETALTGMYMQLMAVCDSTGVTCKPGCKETIDTITASNACLSGSTARLTRRMLAYRGGKPLMNMMFSCSAGSYVIDNDDKPQVTATAPGKCVFDPEDDDDCNGLTCRSNALYASVTVTVLMIITNYSM